MIIKKYVLIAVINVVVMFLPTHLNAYALDLEVTQGCSKIVAPPKPNSTALKNSLKIVETDGIYTGLYNIASTKEAYYNFIKNTNKPPAIVFTFHDFINEHKLYAKNPKIRTFKEPLEGDNAPSPIKLAKEIAEHGSVLALTWAIECCDFSSLRLWYNLKKPNDIVHRILQGEFDEKIRQSARQIKELKHPIFLSLFGEYAPQSWFLFGKTGQKQINNTSNICNKYGDPSWPDGPERIRDTYIRVIDIFREEQVNNVTWFMYNSTGYMNKMDPDHTEWVHPKYYYPGDDYIDWIGQSTYFIDPKYDPRPNVDEEISTIDYALSSAYEAWTSITNKPIYLVEFGILSDDKHSRSRIIKHTFNDYLPRMPRIKAFTFANADLFKRYFDMPILGSKFKDEISSWIKSVSNNPLYLEKVVIEKNNE